MHFKNVFKSSKGALIKEKKMGALSDTTLCLVTISFEQSQYSHNSPEKRMLVYTLRVFISTHNFLTIFSHCESQYERNSFHIVTHNIR